MPCLPAEVVPWKHKDWKSDWGQPVAKYAWHFWNKTLRILTAESHQLFICTFPIHCITFLKSTMVLTSWNRDNSNKNQLFPLELVRSMPSFAVEVNARIGLWGLRWHENRLKPVLQEMSLIAQDVCDHYQFGWTYNYNTAEWSTSRPSIEITTSNMFWPRCANGKKSGQIRHLQTSSNNSHISIPVHPACAQLYPAMLLMHWSNAPLPHSVELLAVCPSNFLHSAHNGNK